MAPFVTKGDQWFSFDDKHSIRVKSEYLVKQGFAGGFVWSIDTDDFNDICGGGKFGLIAQIQDVLNGGFQTPPPGWTTPQPDDEGGENGTNGPAPPPPPPTDLCDAENLGLHTHPDNCRKDCLKSMNVRI